MRETLGRLVPRCSATCSCVTPRRSRSSWERDLQFDDTLIESTRARHPAIAPPASRPRMQSVVHAAVLPRASERPIARGSGRNARSWRLLLEGERGERMCSPVAIGVAAKCSPPPRRTAPERRKPRRSGAFCDAPKRTRTSTRLSRTRPSTWRVYQFRHRREGDGEYSPPRPRVESVRKGRYLVRTHVRAT